MVLKKIDNRIRVVIENGVQQKHRTLFFVIGDKARDQVIYSLTEEIFTLTSSIYLFLRSISNFPFTLTQKETLRNVLFEFKC